MAASRARRLAGAFVPVRTRLTVERARLRCRQVCSQPLHGWHMNVPSFSTRIRHRLLQDPPPNHGRRRSYLRLRLVLFELAGVGLSTVGDGNFGVTEEATDADAGMVFQELALGPFPRPGVTCSEGSDPRCENNSVPPRHTCMTRSNSIS